MHEQVGATDLNRPHANENLRTGERFGESPTPNPLARSANESYFIRKEDANENYQRYQLR